MTQTDGSAQLIVQLLESGLLESVSFICNFNSRLDGNKMSTSGHEGKGVFPQTRNGRTKVGSPIHIEMARAFTIETKVSGKTGNKLKRKGENGKV